MSMNWPTMKMRHHKFKDFRVEQNMGKLNRLPKGDVPILMRKLSALQSYVGGIKYMLLKIVIIVGKKKYGFPRMYHFWEFDNLFNR